MEGTTTGKENEALHEDFLRLILQFCKEKNLMETAHKLEAETTVFFDLQYLESHLREGKFDEAEEYFLRFVGDPKLAGKIDTKIHYLIKHQKFIETLEIRKDKKAAYAILQDEWKDWRVKATNIYKMHLDALYYDDFREYKAFAEYTNYKERRETLVEEIKTLLQGSESLKDKLNSMDNLPPGRLRKIINQSINYQLSKCKACRTGLKPAAISTLLRDHSEADEHKQKSVEEKSRDEKKKRQANGGGEGQVKKQKTEESEGKKKKLEGAVQPMILDIKPKEEGPSKEEEEQKRQKEEEERRRQKEEEKRRLKEEDDKRRLKEEEDKRRLKEEEEKKRLRAEEEKKKEQEERKKREREEEKRREEERKQKEKEEKEKKKVEEEKKKAEEARREEERKRKEEERRKREEEEKLRARQKLEEESKRRDEEKMKVLNTLSNTPAPAWIKVLPPPFSTQPSSVARVLYNNKGDLTLSLTADGRIHLWKWVEEFKARYLPKTPDTFKNTLPPSGDAAIYPCMAITNLGRHVFSACGDILSLFALTGNFSQAAAMYGTEETKSKRPDMPNSPVGIPTAVDVSKVDNNIFAVGIQEDFSIRIYSVQTFEEQAKLIGHSAVVTSIAFREDYLISGSENGEVIVWKLKTTKLTEDGEKKSTITKFSLDSHSTCTPSPKGGKITLSSNASNKLILCSQKDSISIIDPTPTVARVTSTWDFAKTVPGSPPSTCAIFLLDGSRVVAAFESGPLLMIPVDTAEEKFGSGTLQLSLPIGSSYPTAMAAHPTNPSRLCIATSTGDLYQGTISTLQ